MNRSLLSAFVILPVVLLLAGVGKAAADNCKPAVGVSTGTVWTWGTNREGQLGDGTITNHFTPAPVQSLSGVTAIAAGQGHNLAVTTDQMIWAWGQNFNGQVGDGTTNERHSPVRVPNLSGVTAVAGGDRHSLALKIDGTVWAWGKNVDGQLGDGTFLDRHTPVQVQNLSGVTAVAGGFAHSLALKSDGTVWAWGQNVTGQLGDGTNDSPGLTPVQVHNLSAVTCIAAGDYHSLAVKSDGTVWAWGRNDFGQLGDGTIVDRHEPVPIVSGGFTAVTGGGRFSLALRNDGTVWAWGVNGGGELGDETLIDRHTPTQVKGLSGVIAITAHTFHSLALKIIAPPVDGIVQAWGLNGAGELGDGTTLLRQFPVKVRILSGVKAIAAGSFHSLAVAAPGAFLNVRNILVHPDTHRLRLFNLRIDGVVVRANDNGGSTGFQLVSPGKHTVDETGGTGTFIGAFGTVIGGDCAVDGTVNLAPGSMKTCTITNFDHEGGCRDKPPNKSVCCEPGDGAQGCLMCSKPGHGCP